MRKLLIFSMLCSSCIFLKAQSNDDIFSIYESQYAQLLNMRGMGGDEISAIMKQYASSNIDSDSSLAAILGKLYSSERNIGILFYIFNNDTLRRAYYEPGKVISVEKIPVTKNALLSLGQDVSDALNLEQLGSKRNVVQRGAAPLVSNNTARSFSTVIQKATQLLLPRQLDKQTKHLIIVPALNIGTFPFHLLQPFGNGTYLSDHCSYTVAPGLVDLIALRSALLKNNSPDWDGIDLRYDFDENPEFPATDRLNFLLSKLLIIGNPSYPKDSAFIFPDLPGASREVAAVLPFAKGNYILLEGKNARKDSVLKYITNSGVVYFATHGIADTKDPMGKSFLVLSEPSPFLTAREIMNLRESREHFPEMVILSACQTGLGKATDAGTAGLARSFLLAGSKHVIMSLWNVDDNATAYFMSRFIFHLQASQRFMPAEQLRLAMLDTKKIYNKPWQWGSFSLFGVDF